jgi:hypothetical protein
VAREAALDQGGPAGFRGQVGMNVPAARNLHQMVQEAEQSRTEHGVERIGLAGGVFQNRLLAEKAVARLEGRGFRVFLPSGIPTNDAGLSFGQIIEQYGSAFDESVPPLAPSRHPLQIDGSAV